MLANPRLEFFKLKMKKGRDVLSITNVVHAYLPAHEYTPYKGKVCQTVYSYFHEANNVSMTVYAWNLTAKGLIKIK